MEHCTSHLFANALTVMLDAEPRTGLDRTQCCKVGGHQILNANGLAVHEYRAAEVPFVGVPLGSMTPTPLKESAFHLGRGCVGPGLQERHRVRVVNTALRDVGERHQVLVGGKSDLDAWRSDPQVKEGPEMVLHGQLSLTSLCVRRYAR